MNIVFLQLTAHRRVVPVRDWGLCLMPVQSLLPHRPTKAPLIAARAVTAVSQAY